MAYVRERTGPEAAIFGAYIRRWRRLEIGNAKDDRRSVIVNFYDVKSWSLRKLAKELGISKNTLEDYEKGKRYPPIEFVYDLSVVMGIPQEELIKKWCDCHPNPNVRASENPMFRAVRFFRSGPAELRRYRKDSTIKFLMAAFNVGLQNQAPGKLSAREVGGVVSWAALIIDYALRKGLDPHPYSVELVCEEVQEMIDEMEYQESVVIANARALERQPQETLGTAPPSKPRRGRQSE